MKNYEGDWELGSERDAGRRCRVRSARDSDHASRISLGSTFQIATIPCLIAKWVSSALVWICRDSII